MVLYGNCDIVRMVNFLCPQTHVLSWGLCGFLWHSLQTLKTRLAEPDSARQVYMWPQGLLGGVFLSMFFHMDVGFCWPR